VVKVISEHASPATLADGEPGPGRPYRLVVGSYPIPEASKEIPPVSKELPPASKELEDE
jgi:hypothetical protein